MLLLSAPVGIIRYIDEHSCLDVRNLSADLVEQTSQSTSKSNWSLHSPISSPPPFLAAAELDNMVNLLEARATTLLVPGIAGIGKTTVASKLIERFMHRETCCIIDAKTGRIPFLLRIGGRFFSSMGNADFSTYLAATPFLNPQMQLDCWSRLGGNPSLLVIDDFHKVSDMVFHQTFRMLALLGSEEKIGLVIFSFVQARGSNKRR